MRPRHSTEVVAADYAGWLYSARHTLQARTSTTLKEETDSIVESPLFSFFVQTRKDLGHWAPETFSTTLSEPWLLPRAPQIDCLYEAVVIEDRHCARNKRSALRLESNCNCATAAGS